MKRAVLVIIFAIVIMRHLSGQTETGTISGTEALTVAQNWITLITAKTGSWAGVPDARALEARELIRQGECIGYFCPVSPRGWIILPPYRCLAPVKAYSSNGDLDPAESGGLAALIMDSLARLHRILQKDTGLAGQPVPSFIESGHRRLREILSRTPAAFKSGLTSGLLTVDYQSSTLLLSSAWHQNDPYNQQTPAGNGCTHTLVGCVATAAAMIMHYWCWPPAGNGEDAYLDPYDWPNMPDRFDNWTLYPQAQYDAVAELCKETADAAGMTYGCSESSANTAGMEDVYPDNFFYHADKIDRDDYTASEWFAKIKESLNQNQPIQYRVEGHSMACDGWREIGSSREYHINYGWGNNRTAWYTLDQLHYPAGGELSDEFMIREIYPQSTVNGSGCAISGTFNPGQTWTFRYFHKDTCGGPATFAAGQWLQFLPGARLASTTGTIRIDSTGALPTILFSRGDPAKGIRLYTGSIVIYQDGGLNFYPLGAPRYLSVSTYSANSVTLTWEDGYGYPSGFEVERYGSTDSGWSWSQAGSSTGTGNTYTDTGVQPSRQYIYRLRAVGFGGASIYSNEVQVSTPSQ